MPDEPAGPHPSYPGAALPINRLDNALDEARAKGWIVVDMKNDWKRIFAFEK